MSNWTLAKAATAPAELAAALAALERGGAVTTTSLDLEDPNISWEAWIGMGEMFRRLRAATRWWIGDWYIFGGVRFGENRASAAEGITGLDPHTLATVVRTCMYVPKSRRRLELPFSHHTEVARLMPEEQDRFLNMAIEHRFTRNQLRQAVKDWQKGYDQIESAPQWEAAEGMKRQLDVEKIAYEIYARARRGPIYWMVESELMTRLGVALGQEGEE